MDQQMTEAGLLQAMASAKSLDEQQALAARLEEMRGNARTAAAAATESMWVESTYAVAPPTPRAAPYSRTTSDSDWLDKVATPQVDPREAETQMRSEASAWYSHLHPGVKAHPEEVLIQAAGLSDIRASQFGKHASRAQVAFLEQIRHHAETEGLPIPDPASIRPEPYEHGQHSDDTQTDANDTPSLAEGDQPDSDAAPAQSPNQSENLDASTWPSADWNNGDEPPGQKTSALSDADKAKVIPAMGYEVTRADVEAAMTLPSGSRPRIYAYWDNGTGNPQVVKITSQHYLDKYGPDVEFYWGTNASMDNVDQWMVSRASRKTAAWTPTPTMMTTLTVSPPHGPRAMIGQITQAIMSVGTEDVLELTVNGVRYIVTRYSTTATTDFGTPDRQGRQSGDFTVYYPSGQSKEFYFGPSDPGGRAAAEDAANSIANNARHASRKTAGEYQGGSPKEGDTATCHKDGGKIQFFAGEWMHLKGTGDSHNDVYPASKDKTAVNVRQGSRKTAVYNGDRVVLKDQSGTAGTGYRPGTVFVVQETWYRPGDNEPMVTVYKEDEVGTTDVFKNSEVKTASSRRTASEGTVCATCGDKIAKDPASEDPSTWHHDNGTSHDHEAKPASKESSRKTAIDANVIDLSVCGDCLMAAANGYDPHEWGRTADPKPWAEWEGYPGHPVAGDAEDGSFSHHMCEGCGSRLGGDRYPAYWMEPKRASQASLRRAASRIEVKDQDKPALTALSRLKSVDETFQGIPGRQIVSHLLQVGQMDQGTRRSLQAALRPKQASDGWTKVTDDDALYPQWEKKVSGGVLQVNQGLGGYVSWAFVNNQGYYTGGSGSANSVEEAKADAEASVKTASRRRQAAVGDPCWSCEGKGWYSTISYDYDPYEGQRMEITCSTCGGSGVVNEPTDYPLADDPIFTDRYAARARTAGWSDFVQDTKDVLRGQPRDLRVTPTEGPGPESFSEWTQDDVEEIGRARKTAAARPLHQIADEIRADWKNVYFGAVPYLDAMSVLDSINDSYGHDPARDIVVYFLSNASGWRGEKAREIKKELKALTDRRTGSRKGAAITDQSLLMAIQEKDPSGKEKEPTEADHQAFEAWVKRSYGEDVWKDYHTNWADPTW